jgi:hypothetical protein
MNGKGPVIKWTTIIDISGDKFESNINCINKILNNNDGGRLL